MSTDKSIDWNSVIKKEAVGIGGIDLGELHEIGDEYIITQKGFLIRNGIIFLNLW